MVSRAGLNHGGRGSPGMVLVPGEAVGEFYIGMILHEAIELIKKQDRETTQVKVKYHPKRPFSTDIALDLPTRGLLLRFDPKQQRLRLIEIYNVLLMGELYYNCTLVGTPEKPPTFHRVYSCFGHSVPGQYSPDKQNVVYLYEAQALLFRIEAKEQPS